MELLKKKIKKFLTLDISFGDGSGYGHGDGSGYGFGDGSGDGSGHGYGSGSDYGYGYGHGYGSDYSYGDGSGDGSGDGYGYGYGDGSGHGSGDGYGSVKSINGISIHIIDGVPTLITNIVKNVAKGFIINTDLAFKKCYVVKGSNMFAHGETLKKANEDLQSKTFQQLDVEDKIKEFKKIFKENKKYKCEEFYKWHNLLTGSCEMGRKTFMKNHNISMEDTFTVKEFIELCKNDYGGEVIRKLEE